MENQLEISIWRDTQSWAAEQGGHWGTVPPHFCKNQENVPFFSLRLALLEILTLQLFTLLAVLNTLLYLLKLYKIEKRIVHSIFSNFGGGGVKGIKYTSFSLLRGVPFFGGASAAYAPRHNHIQTYADYHAGLSTNMKAADRNIFQAGKPSSRLHI